jgi:hypothetical protein
VGSQYPFLEVSSDDEDEAEEQYIGSNARWKKPVIAFTDA